MTDDSKDEQIARLQHERDEARAEVAKQRQRADALEWALRQALNRMNHVERWRNGEANSVPVCKAAIEESRAALAQQPAEHPVAGDRVTDPTPEEQGDPLFEAIWQTIKRWDVDTVGRGYHGATGNEAAAILRAIRNAPATAFDPDFDDPAAEPDQPATAERDQDQVRFERAWTQLVYSLADHFALEVTDEQARSIAREVLQAAATGTTANVDTHHCGRKTRSNRP